MANITKVLGRHDWQPMKIPQLRDGLNDDPKRMKLLCFNCRKPWDEQNQGPPPLTGCLTDIKVRNVGTDRMRDYHRQEMKLLEEGRKAEREREAYMDRKLEEYLLDYKRRHG